ncbi:MAG: glutathione S-transferase N-terminal domain-containing protein [Pseudomonadota bacterium]
MPASYDVFVFHRSYFCGKMLAYLRYKQIPFTPIYKPLSEVGLEIARNTGLRQMPVIRTPDGTWLHDTTPMIDWFEARHPDPPITIGDPVTDFLMRLLEDYADEWLWRPAILSRWEAHVDGHYYETLFPTQFLGGLWAKARPLTWIAGKLVKKHQTDKFLAGDGLTKDNRDYVWSIYTDTLARLETIFQIQPYLLGDRPCLADFGFFGSMFWHFSNDPTPSRMMQEQAPGVYEWVARMWNMTAKKAQGKTFASDTAPDLWAPLLADACAAYLPYLHANARALEAGDTRFDLDIQGHKFPAIHVSPYRAWCRERLQGFLTAMSEPDQARIQSILDPLGGWVPLTADAHIRSGWDPEGTAPVCKPRDLSLTYRLLAPFTGTNHVRTRRA